MKVCTHNGLTIAVLTRNEHCPPHVHTGTSKWEARFEFSFWHDGVRLWDVVPEQHQPTAKQLEAIRQTLKQPANLRRTREIWWNGTQTVCLVNQRWDAGLQEVVSGAKPPAKVIKAASFNARVYKTVLLFGGQTSPHEIEL